MSDYNIEHYSIQELLDIFNIDIPSKSNITYKIDQYSKRIKNKDEQDFINNAKEKLLNWINKPLINSNSHSVMINRESTHFIKTKEIDDVADPILLNPLYRNILTRTVNIDSGFRSNSLPKGNETRNTYNSINLKLEQANKKKYTKSCLLNTTSSTNFVATFSDRLNSILSFQLINYTIPYTWYNIDTQYFNNQFTIYTSANDISAISIELLSGNYTLNNIYDTINDTIKNNTNLKPTQKIIFNYDDKTSKTNIDIYQKYQGTNDLYYQFKWFDKTELNSKSNNTLGYKLGFRHLELIIDGDIENINNKPIIYLELNPTTYTPLLQEPIILKETAINNIKPYYDICGAIYFTSNNIDLYMTDNSLQRFIITYKKEPIYYLSDTDFSSSGSAPTPIKPTPAPAPTPIKPTPAPTPISTYGNYVTKKGDSCNQIMQDQCPSSIYPDLICSSFTDCSAICNSSKVCPNLKPETTILYDCCGQRKHCPSYYSIPRSTPTPILPPKVGWGIFESGEGCNTLLPQVCPSNSYPPSPSNIPFICTRRATQKTVCGSLNLPGDIYTYSCTGTPYCSTVYAPSTNNNIDICLLYTSPSPRD